MARLGMSYLISRLRLFTETVDNPLSEGDYFTDDQLQDELDRTVREFVRIPLRPSPLVVSGNTNVYRDYFWLDRIGRDLERPDQSDYPNGNFLVQDSVGNPVFFGDGEEFFTVDWAIPKIVFGKDRAGHTFYLTCRSYDLYAAAASVWLIKAGKRQQLIHWKTDNHTLHEDQEYNHCLQQYEYYSRKSSGNSRVTKFIRTDMNPYRY